MRNFLPALALFAMPMAACAQQPTLDIANPDATCGNLIYIDYGSAADGPAYYTDKQGNIISNCGGFRQPQPNEEPQYCPPKEWTCEQPPAATRNNHAPK